MPRPSHLSPDNILRFLQVRTAPASATEIAQGLHLKKSDNRPLFKMLSKLKKRRAIEELPGGRYRLPGRKSERDAPGQESPQGAPRHSPPSPLPGRDEVKGRLVLHHDGYGFVVPDSPMPQLDGDVFIPRDAIQDAMHGDHVLAKIQRLGGVTGAQRAEGRILRVLDRAHPTVVGLFRYGSQGNVVLPYDVRIQYEIEIPRGNELTPGLWKKLGFSGADETSIRSRRIPRLDELDGAVVNVELLRYPHGGASPTGRIIEILGHPGELGVDTEIIIRKHHLPHVFSAEVLDEAERGATPVGESERAGREDFRRLPIVTIDGETARDFDDAVYVEHRADGGWHLQVHIADVAHYVRTQTVLDQEARLRGTSVYFPDRAVPMLPEALSSGMCSLKPREDRLVMSALMEFDAAGNMKSSRMTSGVIRSAERMTYTNVNKVLEGDSEMSKRYASLAPRFRDMKELALLLNARRNERGSIDFDLPEPVIEFDEEQRMTNITRSERNIAHRLIEEFMLSANRAVAAYLLRRGIESLHRVHEKPDARKVLEFEELARAFGYSLGVEDLHQREVAVRHGHVPAPAKAGRPDSYGHGRERGMKVALPGGDLRITPQHYQRLIKKVVGKPEERIVSYLMLRSLKQARYAAEPLGHFALGFDEYTHFTSPIRRYPDLIVHRILKWALEHPNAAPPTSPMHSAAPPGAEAALYSHKNLEEIAAETSEAERRANGAERELMDWKTAQFMEEHLGEEYDGLIISVQKYGCFVELFEVFVEGLLPIGALEEFAGARCVLRERDHAIVALAGGGAGRGPRGSRRAPSTSPYVRAGGASGTRLVSGRATAASVSGRGSKPRQLEWHLGDKVRVRAERIDPMRKRVEFALIDL
ncbi:MAG TPA: RNB domain-containing ribonuclease [Candidatus Polarisedimenticolia bacterium]|nr:RNB domain-containing ribonuclease [Candidatus Polarisedimenticolia bacterium]